MNHLDLLFKSPDLYPTGIDWPRRVMRFIRMSPETYRNSIFLDARALSVGDDIYEIRLDDLYLAATILSRHIPRLHYIFHTTFCCSTLLARCFESLENCIVLKEPLLLSELAVQAGAEGGSDEILGLAVQLLTRTYHPGDRVVIKAHEPCNCIARDLLQINGGATATFLITSLRQFLLSVLKSGFRRKWVRSRIPAAAEACDCYPLMNTTSMLLSDAEAAAYLWLVNRYLCEQLLQQAGQQRVQVINGDQLARSPNQLLPTIARHCSLSLSDLEIMSMVKDPSLQKYSKDLSRQYCAASRETELGVLEKKWGREADLGMKWAATTGMECSLSGLPLLSEDVPADAWPACQILQASGQD